MAKRKRLALPFAADEVPAPDYDPRTGAGPEPGGPYPLGVAPALSAPIARVAADAAATSALRDLADEVARSRAEGRLVEALPLEAVEDGWLTRDRVGVDEAELIPLIDSLRLHGQRSPIEVVVLPPIGPAPPRFGLISGWRRLTALRRLHAETGEARFATVLAIQRRPEGAGDAYIAMVEENEIRLGLSYYERARIVALARSAQVFATHGEALDKLFAGASRAKRSKIRSFITLFEVLDPDLRFPGAIPERLGLALVARIKTDDGFATRLSAVLKTERPATALAEQALLGRFLKAGGGTGPASGPAPAPSRTGPGETELRKAELGKTELGEVAPGLRLTASGSVLRIEGPGVTADLVAALRDWLRARAGD